MCLAKQVTWLSATASKIVLHYYLFIIPATDHCRQGLLKDTSN